MVMELPPLLLLQHSALIIMHGLPERGPVLFTNYNTFYRPKPKPTCP